MKIKIKCDWCGKIFERNKGNIKERNYCSRACLGKANGKRLKKDHTMICDFCGNTYQGNKKHSNRNKHFFCSAECANAFKTKKIKVECDLCGKVFLKKRSDIERCNHNFCSAECNRSYLFLINENSANQKVNRQVLYRTIAEHKIGRKLKDDEEVHHIDGNHNNHAPSNLLVVTASEHSKIHAALKERDVHGKFVKHK